MYSIFSIKIILLKTPGKGHQQHINLTDGQTQTWFSDTWLYVDRALESVLNSVVYYDLNQWQVHFWR